MSCETYFYIVNQCLWNWSYCLWNCKMWGFCTLSPYFTIARYTCYWLTKLKRSTCTFCKITLFNGLKCNVLGNQSSNATLNLTGFYMMIQVYTHIATPKSNKSLEHLLVLDLMWHLLGSQPRTGWLTTPSVSIQNL